VHPGVSPDAFFIVIVAPHFIADPTLHRLPRTSLRMPLQLSLRGAKRRGNLQHYDPVRLPRRFAPRNDVIGCSINACLFDVRLFIFPDIVDSCGNRYNDDKGVHY